MIYERADAEKPFMGLTSFSGELPALKDISIAKNYLSEDELKIYDYVEQLDSVLSFGNRKLLSGSGKVSHDQAVKKQK